jgi:hypothetical protein
MKPLFTIQASNTHQSLLIQDSSVWESISAAINRSPIAGDGLPRVFDFQQVDKQAVSLPDICTVYISGALAFRSELKEQLFPHPSTNLEFLPITASGESWLLLNCLQAASDIDPAGSEVMRGLNGDICFVMEIRVTDPKAQEWDVFTLTDSNRAQLFVTDAFRERVQKLKLKGITFRAIGEVV